MRNIIKFIKEKIFDFFDFIKEKIIIFGIIFGIILTIILVSVFTGGCHCVSTKVATCTDCDNPGDMLCSLLCGNEEEPVSCFCENQPGFSKDSENVQCTWYPFYCGTGRHAMCDSCGTCVICGWDLFACALFDTQTEYSNSMLETRKVKKANLNKDVKINYVEAFTDYGYLKELGVIDYGTDILKYDFKSFLKNFQSGNLDIAIYIIISYTNKVELAGIKASASLGTKHDIMHIGNSSYAGNPIDGLDYDKARNIQPGTHYLMLALYINPLEMFELSGDSTIDIVAEVYEE